MKSTWFTVGPLVDIPRLGAKVVRLYGTPVAIFRTQSDEVFALEDHCPHKRGPLSQGIVHDHKVSCPLHGWVIELDKGTAMAPDEGCTPSYPVRVTDGVIEIEVQHLDAMARAATA
ncbi:nitrite reductase small subunit NirD [Halothiobacillus sp.]|uniref:nitrite reductase small subunit NirD n=1 Tax=Halothiobacillus sp. TaxID=1891311 RepID=UPI002602E680|nr:nitrite reductase small subunit NirD [Halothiobacillus sp.]